MKMKENLVLIEGFSFYTDRSYVVYDCKMGSFVFALNSKNISGWKLLMVFTIIQVNLL